MINTPSNDFKPHIFEAFKAYLHAISLQAKIGWLELRLAIATVPWLFASIVILGFFALSFWFLLITFVVVIFMHFGMSFLLSLLLTLLLNTSLILFSIITIKKLFLNLQFVETRNIIKGNSQ